MSFFLDILILGVMVSAVIGGYKRGFIRSVMNLASAVLSFVASVFFTPYLSKYLCDNFILKGIASGIEETLGSLLGVGSATVRSTEQLFLDMPDALHSIFTRFGIDSAAFIKEFSTPELATAETVSAMSESIAESSASAISSIAAFFILFVGFSIIMKILTATLDAVFELPVLKQLNSAAGLLFGIAAALFYGAVWSALAVSAINALSTVDPATFTLQVIDETVLVKLFSGIRMTFMTEVLV